jgi:hypothetical protein
MTANTTPISAYGTALTWAGHDVGYIMSISGPSMKVDVIEYHTSESASKQKVAGHIDPGQLTVEVQLINGATTGQKYFMADLKARTETITPPDSDAWTFNAIATGFTPGFPSDGMMTATLTMDVSGDVVTPLDS